VTQQDPAPADGSAPATAGAPGTSGNTGTPGNTGDARVDEALGQLADLEGLPVHEHPAIFGQMYEALTGALGALEVTPDPAAPGPGHAPGR